MSNSLEQLKASGTVSTLYSRPIHYPAIIFLPLVASNCFRLPPCGLLGNSNEMHSILECFLFNSKTLAWQLIPSIRTSASQYLPPNTADIILGCRLRLW